MIPGTVPVSTVGHVVPAASGTTRAAPANRTGSSVTIAAHAHHQNGANAHRSVQNHGVSAVSRLSGSSLSPIASAPASSFGMKKDKVASDSGSVHLAAAAVAAPHAKPALSARHVADAVDTASFQVAATGVLRANGYSPVMSRLERHLSRATASRHLVFVYGTLKRSFPNSHLLSAAMYVGDFRTVQQYPLVVGGPWFSPYLLNMQGKGQQVKGEVYAVDDAELSKLDELENIGVNYTRKVIPVHLDDDDDSNLDSTSSLEGAESAAASASAANLLHVHAYLKCNYTPDLVNKAWLAEYQDRRYVPRHKRPATAPAPKHTERVAAVSSAS